MNITSLPARTDNYIHLIRLTTSHVAVVDPTDHKPVLNFLQTHNLSLTHILLTHHHDDHIAGVTALVNTFPSCEVVGFSEDLHRLPKVTKLVTNHSRLTIADNSFEVWHLPGHTTGHIAYISSALGIAFTGDVIFGMGCGRVFEGTYQEMFQSLERLKCLAPSTKIYCAHEYTERNGRFAVSLFPDHELIRSRYNHTVELRRRGESTVPLLLGQELQTNPFLLAKNLSEFSFLRNERNKAMV